MARFAFFADLPNGETLEWRDTVVRGQVQGARGIRYIGSKTTLGFDGSTWIKVTRKIEMKSFPSKHECDARCMYATGLIMKCECQCGGKNHGKGAALVCTA